MKKTTSLFVFLVIIVVLLSGGLAIWVWGSSAACARDCQTKSFTVYKDENLNEIIRRLYEAGLIRSPFIFKIISVSQGIDKKIQAGDFNLNAGMNPREMALRLTHGAIDQRVMIIEGLRREEIADILAESNLSNFDKEEFLKTTGQLEGKLFPDTYFIPKEMNTDKIIALLVDNFNKKAGKVSNEELILASLIEREVIGESDRKIIAGILLKRLSSGWPLQVDSTVQYALGNRNCKPEKTDCSWWPKKVYLKDLAIKSEYNTYLNNGLPPGPICNPGVSAINAVKNPTVSDYWYYLSDDQGIIHYAKTSEEQDKNIRKFISGN